MGGGGGRVLKLQDGYEPASGCLLMATRVCLRGSRISRTGFDDGAGLPKPEITYYLCPNFLDMYVCVLMIKSVSTCNG